ncbi:hypothetical protein UFOVP1004_46 [uncultured Caudovirales phage]|uniref:Uncharacterized protein n=1 Tax=uncultured Caudovirales phage TaxID=2100421 RepID=A0A6J5Q610_9CAUD|nr:hypothetical protein UFOVP1004_46 [uncultured Caudovirales phage]
MSGKYKGKVKERRRAAWAKEDASKGPKKKIPKCPRKNEPCQPREHKPLGSCEIRACGGARKHASKKGGLGDENFRPVQSYITLD